MIKFIKYFSLLMIVLYGLGGVLLAARVLQMNYFSPTQQVILGCFLAGYAVFRYTRWRKMPFNQVENTPES